MKRNLKDVFWLGGSPCAGKSSISNILASRFDLDVYRVDEAFENHVQKLDSEVHATLVKWCAASWNERWMQSVESLVQEVIACYREHFTLILDDVLALPKHKSLLVEGTALMPKEVARVLTSRNQQFGLFRRLIFNESITQSAIGFSASCNNATIRKRRFRIGWSAIFNLHVGL